ncbi:MAG: hypothetical protein R3185_02325, partial [Candidatus Thermoplasmatota archaeon]|nr:hypothetical protein [Candidatus Thermoplasmatota archaeon]
MAASTPGRREAPAAPESIVARTLAALHRRDHAWLGPEGTPLGSAEEVLEDLALVLTAAMDLNDTTLF